MSTQWRPPTAESGAGTDAASGAAAAGPGAGGAGPFYSPAASPSSLPGVTSADVGGDAHSSQPQASRVPPPRVLPFKCDHCYEKTIGWDADELINPRTDPATAVRLSQRVQVSNTFSFLHTLFLKQDIMSARGPMDNRMYELATLYESPNRFNKLWCNFDTAANVFLLYEGLLGRHPNFSTFLAVDLFLKQRQGGTRAYVQYKTDRFCTRGGVALDGLKPSMYTVSHLQGINRRLAIGGKVNMLHGHDRRMAAALSAQFDTGAGVLSVTGTTAKKVTASCTRRIAHPSTPDQTNVTVAAELKLDTQKPAASTAALGYSLRFPMSNSLIKGSIDSLYKLRCTVESDLEFLAVRTFFSSRMDFLSHSYKFGLGISMGGEYPKPRLDNNPLLGALPKVS